MLFPESFATPLPCYIAIKEKSKGETHPRGSLRIKFYIKAHPHSRYTEIPPPPFNVQLPLLTAFLLQSPPLPVQLLEVFKQKR
jgi:hypothetical protein